MEGNDWDLFAIVRGCGRRREKATTTEPVTDSSLYVSTDEVEMDPLLEASSSCRSGFEELEEFFKPFFFAITQPQPQRASLHAAAASAEPTIRVPKPSQRSRKRRPQQKKVVCHVPADSVSSDVWAWRKYGQKPIKGSPYPRGYYRCSSSKGCLARKLTERSRTDPGTFIVTYTAEHNHPVPTHRNSLAGSTRHKLASPAPPPPPPPPPPERSPNTPLTASTSTEEEEEEGMLLVEDMEVIGEDDFLIVGDDAAAAANTSSASLPDFDDGENGFDDRWRFFAQPWLSSSSSGNNSSNAAASAGGD